MPLLAFLIASAEAGTWMITTNEKNIEAYVPSAFEWTTGTYNAAIPGTGVTAEYFKVFSSAEDFYAGLGGKHSMEAYHLGVKSLKLLAPPVCVDAAEVRACWAPLAVKGKDGSKSEWVVGTGTKLDGGRDAYGGYVVIRGTPAERAAHQADVDAMLLGWRRVGSKEAPVGTPEEGRAPVRNYWEDTALSEHQRLLAEIVPTWPVEAASLPEDREKHFHGLCEEREPGDCATRCEAGAPHACLRAAAQVEGEQAAAFGRRALGLWRADCEAGEPYSCVRLGEELVRGEHVTADPAMIRSLGAAAVALAQLACRDGDWQRCRSISGKAQYGVRGVLDADVALAAELERQGYLGAAAACAPDALEACRIAMVGSDKVSGLEDAKSRFTEMNVAACPTDPKACFVAAQRIEGGHGATVDPVRAAALRTQGLELLLGRCDAGDARACADAAGYLSQGLGAPADRRREVALLEKACDLGDGPSCSMGAYVAGARTHYETGEVEPALDAALALALEKKGCALGEVDGCNGWAKAEGAPEAWARVLSLCETTNAHAMSSGCWAGVDALRSGAPGIPVDAARADALQARICEVSGSDRRCPGYEEYLDGPPDGFYDDE